MQDAPAASGPACNTSSKIAATASGRASRKQAADIHIEKIQLVHKPVVALLGLVVSKSALPRLLYPGSR